MIVLNRRDGGTERFDLADTGEARRLNRIGADPKLAAEVSGLWIKIDARATTLPTPKRFRRVSFFAEVVRDGAGTALAEKLTIQADDVEVAATMWLAPDRPARVDLRRTGRRVFDPSTEDRR